MEENVWKRQKVDQQVVDGSKNSYVKIMQDVGLCKNAAEIVMQCVGIAFCSRHNTYFPSILASCCLCFNITTSDFTTPDKFLMYKYHENPAAQDDNHIFQAHLVHFCHELQPTVRKLGYGRWYSCVFIGNLKRDMDVSVTPIILFTDESDICTKWRTYNTKRLFLDQNHDFIKTVTINDARNLICLEPFSY